MGTKRSMAVSLLCADVKDAPLPVALVHAHHHALRIEADAPALGETVPRVYAPQYALIAPGRLHRLAHLLLVGATGAADGVCGHHDAIVAEAHRVIGLRPHLLGVTRDELLYLWLLGIPRVDEYEPVEQPLRHAHVHRHAEVVV